MNISEDIRYVGVTDHNIDKFEGQFFVPDGMTYNSYVIIDEKIAVLDTVDRKVSNEWMDNVAQVLSDRKPDYLIVQHMEPDHSANIVNFMNAYPEAMVVASDRAFRMMNNYFGNEWSDRQIVVGENDVLNLGKHTLTFYIAPMVHWPEVIVTYDDVDKVLFTADGFGRFGTLNQEQEWDKEARRYYFGIVGKYGMQVQELLKKTVNLDIRIICPLHGPVLKENLDYYLRLYNTWSSYGEETDGIVIVYTSVYGNTKKAVGILEDKLIKNGCKTVVIHDLLRADMSEAVADAFRYGKIIFATTTYNSDIFPFMKDYINRLTERGFRNKTVGFVENGSWAPQAARVMKKMLEGCANITYTDTTVSIKSSVKEENLSEIDSLANELTMDYVAKDDSIANKYDMKALYKIGYGLYVVTTNDGIKDNGLIVNSVLQVTSSPNRVAVCINKQNYSYQTVKQTGIMNVNCLSVEAPFSIFKSFGFRSGRDADKFADMDVLRSDNGLVFLPQYINAFMSLKVEQIVDLDTHGMFICSITEARVISNIETMTYSYYQQNVKPKSNTGEKKGFVCKVCGYVYEGDEIPKDWTCPVCKHGAEDFEPIVTS